MSERRSRWSFLGIRARLTLLGGLAVLVIAGVLFAVTGSSGWLAGMIGGLLVIRLAILVGFAASRRRRP